MMERVPSKTLYHWCNVATTRVAVKSISSGFRWTDSIFFMFCCLYGFHIQDPYSSLGRTRVRYAVSLTVWLQPPNTRRRRLRVELAFFQIVSTCSFQLKLLHIVTPRYFVELTFDIGMPFKDVRAKIFQH